MVDRPNVVFLLPSRLNILRGGAQSNLTILEYLTRVRPHVLTNVGSPLVERLQALGVPLTIARGRLRPVDEAGRRFKNAIANARLFQAALRLIAATNPIVLQVDYEHALLGAAVS